VYIQLAKNANVTTMRTDFIWTNIEGTKGTFSWSSSDMVMRLTAQAGIRVLAVADYSPKWASSCPSDPDWSHCGPANPADYANFLTKLTERYKEGGAFWTANPTVPYVPLAGIEIWNEPNHRSFWHNPNGGDYARTVIAGYDAVKRVDPSITVLAGATASVASDTTGQYLTAITFMKQMYTAGAQGHFDAFSHHPYSWMSGSTPGEMLSTANNSAWSKMADSNPSLRSIMTANGDGNKKIWVTEFGAPTLANGVTETIQADLANLALAKWKTYPWAGSFYYYNLRDKCSTATDRECHYGSVRFDNSLKPVYSVIKSAYAPP